MRIIVAGGGYAGLACLMELRRRMRDAELVLVDPRDDHLKITHLHETVRRRLSRFQVPYAQLAGRIGLEHCRGAIDDVDPDGVADESSIDVDGRPQAFDYLVIATGSAPPPLPKSVHVYDRNDLLEHNAGNLVAAFLDDEARPRQINVVGGGPTGIQFLFELVARLEASRENVKFCLIDRDQSLLSHYPAAFGDYVLEKMTYAGIDYLSGTEYLGCTNDALELRHIASGEERHVPSGLSFLFPGASPSPRSVQADRFGRINGHANIFGAGDCARFDSRGDDGLTAQVAVRQGKLVAQNIDRLSRNVRPTEYFFRELGYVISLGPLDAVGWLLFKDKVVNNLPAFAIKEFVEAQYDLFVAGMDTYVL